MTEYVTVRLRFGQARWLVTALAHLRPGTPGDDRRRLELYRALALVLGERAEVRS